MTWFGYKVLLVIGIKPFGGKHKEKVKGIKAKESHSLQMSSGPYKSSSYGQWLARYRPGVRWWSVSCRLWKTVFLLYMNILTRSEDKGHLMTLMHFTYWSTYFTDKHKLSVVFTTCIITDVWRENILTKPDRITTVEAVKKNGPCMKHKIWITYMYVGERVSVQLYSCVVPTVMLSEEVKKHHLD